MAPRLATRGALERRAADTPLKMLSETADVFFALSRAHYDDFPIRTLPRFAFRHAAAFLSGAPGHSTVREVVNPAKDHKIGEVGIRHQIDPEMFKRAARILRRVWPLFP
ncbi:hypothetical protein F5Y05DRAFT_411071 [Hypoxylon sp. FL0543]|nr:hypothetical protein F5Y05DRAFT_411071 [Hypoxylon sp. FL0543]